MKKKFKGHYLRMNIEYGNCCYPFLGSHKTKKIKMRKYKKISKKYSKNNISEKRML